MWTKSKFLGLSIGVHNIGKGVVTLLDLGEQYTLTFPNGYGRYVYIVQHENLHRTYLEVEPIHTKIIKSINCQVGIFSMPIYYTVF